MIRFMCVLQVDSDQLQNTLREFVLKAVFINIENHVYTDIRRFWRILQAIILFLVH